MTETYTIEAADDGAAISPAVLRELRDLLRDDDDLDLGVRLKDSPPAPGEQGAIPVALEIVAGAASLGTAFARVLRYWIEKNRLSVEVRNGDTSFKISAANIADAERLFAMVQKAAGAQPDAGA
jgi:hypothetical protein